ncbi:MAG: hypothetical protein JSV66_16555 [Trueperaceae bacterium]|nr:MAG: hypothetical protein JSV66_16555 [Trueperaceae bacterium]
MADGKPVGAALPASLEAGSKRVLLKYHTLLSGTGRHEAHTVEALHEVLTGGAAAIEFDVNLLGDGHYALIHDDVLEHETSGAGRVSRLDRAAFKQLTLRGSGASTCVLDDVTEVLQTVRRPLKVQLDYKVVRPLSRDEAIDFLRQLEPLRGNGALTVVVGCVADWNLRTLRRLDPEVGLGFDPMLYLDAAVDAAVRLPTRVNAYGYYDDHPLGFRRLQAVSDYLRDRVETLAAQVPGAVEYYLRNDLVVRALDDGFDMIHAFHALAPGAVVDVWTLDYGKLGAAETLRRVLERGPDQITTNTALQWAERLG